MYLALGMAEGLLHFTEYTYSMEIHRNEINLMKTNGRAVYCVKPGLLKMDELWCFHTAFI